MFDTDTELTGQERAHLAVLVTTDGFRIFKRIMEAEVEKFNVRLLNTSGADVAAIVDAHNKAKASAQFLAGIINRINSEIELYKHMPKVDDDPVDITAGLIDLGGGEES